jgi:hypothetical protein
VRFVEVQPDHTARTEVADIIAALTDLTRRASGLRESCRFRLSTVRIENRSRARRLPGLDGPRRNLRRTPMASRGRGSYPPRWNGNRWPPVDRATTW